MYQVVYMHKESPFSPGQTQLLRRVVERIGEKAAVAGSFEYYGDDIRLQAERILAEMGAHHS